MNSVEYYVTNMATPSDDSQFLCVLFSNACMARCCQGQAGETSVEIKRLNDELVSLTGQQLIRRIRLFEEMPWCQGGTMSINRSSAIVRYEQCQWHYEHSIQSSKGELAEESCSQQQCQGGTMRTFEQQCLIKKVKVIYFSDEN